MSAAVFAYWDFKMIYVARLKIHSKLLLRSRQREKIR